MKILIAGLYPSKPLFANLVWLGVKSFLTVAVLTLCFSCGEDDKKHFSATASLSFDNASTSLGLDSSTSSPSTFAMKLISAYVTEDIDSTNGTNIGLTAMIYLNPECNEQIRDCDISAGTNEDGAAFGNIVSTFFNFAQTTAQVNAELNAQARAIEFDASEASESVTFNYARLEFCKFNSAKSENIKWGNAASGEIGFARNTCTVNSVKFATPITVTSGSQVSYSIQYNYEQSITTGDTATGDSCTGSGASQICFKLPTFTPSAILL